MPWMNVAHHRRRIVACAMTGATRLVLLSTLALAACRDSRGERNLITDPQIAAAMSAASIAPLYEMANPRRLPGRYIVRFKPSVGDARILSTALAAAHNGRVYQVLRSLKGFWGELPDAAIEPLRRNPYVAYIEADVAVPVADVGDTTQQNAPWQLDRIDQRTLPFNQTYQFSVVGSGVRIWIIDTGVDRNEPDLAGRIDESWYVTIDGKDPYAPCFNHGTPVARAAAGRTSGVAKAATIHSARVDVDCSNGDMSTGATSFAFEFIGDYSPRPAVANNSAGRECEWWGCGPTVDDAAKYARQRGVTVVVSAGNAGENACDFTPAHTTELITVGSSDMNDQRVDHSNYGSCLDIFAPSLNGTSFAAPMVAGVAALHLQLYPTASPSAVESTIYSKATTGVLGNIGSGSPNRLLYSKQRPLVASITEPSTVGPEAYCVWYAIISGGQPPYAYEWRRDGSVVSTGTSYSVSPAGSSNFTIELTVTDGVGRSNFTYRPITIDPNNYEFMCTS